jgi:uncharacterized sulfatase
MYPPSTGSEHMRSMTNLPAGMKMFPQYLREAGYYCTNNSKEDYNLAKPGQVWDVSSKGDTSAGAAGQPFFPSSTSRLRTRPYRLRPHQLIHDPARRGFSYRPDTPEGRHDWAQYYDNIKRGQTGGRHPGRVEKDGLAGDTIVLFYGDHGLGCGASGGLTTRPMCRLWPTFRRSSGTWRRRDRAGGSTDRLVGSSI